MYQYVQKANLFLHDIGNNLSNFFFKYRYVLLISFIVGIIINSIGIFTFKFGVDSEIVPYTSHFNRARYGSLILYKLFPFLTYNIVSQLVGIISLIFASLLMISKYNISNTAKTLFIIMFISCSYFARLQYFFYQSAYNFIGILLVVTAFRLIENNKNIILHLLAVFFLYTGISFYQSNFSVFLSVMMLNIILNFINDRDIKKSISLFLKSILLLLLTLIVYYISIKLISTKLYSIGYLLWIRNNVDYNYIIRMLFNFILYKNIWFYIYTFIIIIYVIFKFNTKKERIFFILLSILLFLAVYSLNILMGNIMLGRSRTPLAILPAFTFLLFYIFKNNSILKTIVIILSFIPIIYNTNNVVKYQISNILQYEQDQMTASTLIDIIYAKYPDIIKGKYKLTFYGRIATSKHPLKPYNTSFFRSPGRILSFMKIMGLPHTVKDSDLIMLNINLSNAPDDLKQLIKNMPSYPSPDCAQLYKDTVIVKLSD